jgi:hypothetical protein
MSEGIPSEYTEGTILHIYNMLRQFILAVGVLVCFWPSAGFAQSVRAGLRAGAQVTPFLTMATSPPLQTASQNGSAPVGPSFELLLPRRITVEASALRKRLNYSTTLVWYIPISGGLRTVTNSDTTATSWEIPLLLKWRIKQNRVSPLVGVGLSLRHIGGRTHSYGLQQVGVASVAPFDRTESIRELDNVWTQGIIGSTGWSLQTGVFHFSPELRYTRWANFALREPRSPRVTSKLDQLEFFVGVTFSIGN